VYLLTTAGIKLSIVLRVLQVLRVIYECIYFFLFFIVSAFLRNKNEYNSYKKCSG